MHKPTRIFLVRHGETTSTENHRIHGHSDAPLTKTGLQHARVTGEYLLSRFFDAFYCSSLGRAHNTAKIIGESIKKEPIPADGLRERFYGGLEGFPLQIFEPDLTGPVLLRPFVRFVLFVSGEHEKDFINRVVSSIQEIIANHPGQRVLVVTHWGVLSILTKFFNNESMISWEAVGPWTACGISEYKSNGKKWQVVQFNSSGHL
jgi:broad specificity phosphatase PhoE